MNPKISVITVVYNGVSTIEQCIVSVINQTYKNKEYIIIDGGSTDGTLDIIKKYEEKITYWISEPDKGVYDAMNRGISIAKGDYLYFLGSDDFVFEPNSFEKLINYCNKYYDLIFSKIKYIEGRNVKSTLGIKTLLHNTVHHQSALYNAKLFTNFRYDTNYMLISDYELNLLIYKGKKKYRFANITLAQCSDGGMSRKQIKKAIEETNLIREKVIGKSISLRLIYGCKYLFIKLKNKCCSM